MTEIFLTPAGNGEAVQLSRTLFRKQILPIGEINYNGKKLKFDRAYLEDLAKSFNGRAYDQVSTMLADAKNVHTMDPRQFGGEVVDVEVTDKGLYGVVRLTEEAAKVVKDSGGKVGVSARIVEGVERNDGESTLTFPRALQHVLITTDPKISGMEAWSEVNLSGYDGDAQVTDLTHANYERTGEMPEFDIKAVTEEQLAAMTDEQLSALTEDDMYYLAGKFKIDLDAEPVNPQAPAAPVLAGASLSKEQQAAIELSNANRDELAAMRAQLAADRFKLESAELLRQGVPPALVELARPLLETALPTVIDLSNGQGSATVDAADVVRQVLKQTAQFVELSKERGYGQTEEVSADDETKALLETWSKQFPDRTQYNG